MKKKYMNIEEAKQYTKLAKSTLYTYVYNDKIPHFKIGNRVLFEEESLTRWMDSKCKRGGQRKSY